MHVEERRVRYDRNAPNLDHDRSRELAYGFEPAAGSSGRGVGSNP